MSVAPPDDRPVVCGVDGSAGSRHALAQAARTAVSRGVRLRAVAAFDPPDHAFGWAFATEAGVAVPSGHELAAAIRADVAQTVDDVLAGLDPPPAPDVDIVVDAGPASSVLLAESEDAVELVVGHRGHHALSALGSVALACLFGASCPVTVVPDPSQKSIVLIGGSSAGRG